MTEIHKKICHGWKIDMKIWQTLSELSNAPGTVLSTNLPFCGMHISFPSIGTSFASRGPRLLAAHTGLAAVSQRAAFTAPQDINSGHLQCCTYQESTGPL